jgi:DNA-binding SARP family transcriptional activator
MISNLQLIDGFDIECQGKRLTVPVSAQRLVALLGLRRSRLHRDYVAGLLWPDASERRAHASLRTAVWRCQTTCPGLLVATAKELELDSNVYVDVCELTQAAVWLTANPAGAHEREVEWLRCSGVLLPGWYDDWVVVERERLRQLILHLLLAVSMSLVARGRFGTALEAALQALQIDPLRESTHRQIIQIHLAEGNAHEAMRQYDICRSLLWREMQVLPSPRMRQLVSSLTIADRD